MSGQRSSVSCRLTRVGAMYTSSPAASTARFCAAFSRNSSSFRASAQRTQRAVLMAIVLGLARLGGETPPVDASLHSE